MNHAANTPIYLLFQILRIREKYLSYLFWVKVAFFLYQIIAQKVRRNLYLNTVHEEHRIQYKIFQGFAYCHFLHYRLSRNR